MEKENRRDFIKKSALLTLGTLTASSILNSAFAAGNFTELLNDDKENFQLPQLPYGYDALEPHIDALTMEIHHSKHHQAYVTNLVKGLSTVDESILPKPRNFENIFAKIDKLPAAVRNNAGGHYNHSLFWTMMKPAGTKGNAPSEKLSAALTKSFGSVDEFKKQFTDASMKHFGSGWAWLVKTTEGKLVISTTPNQDNPLMNLSSIEVKGTPVLALDLWEHAYYLKNQNKRADYIASWWNVVNWETVEGIYNSVEKK